MFERKNFHTGIESRLTATNEPLPVCDDFGWGSPYWKGAGHYYFTDFGMGCHVLFVMKENGPPLIKFNILFLILYTHDQEPQ